MQEQWVVCLAVYLLLQAAFIGAQPNTVVSQGWSNLKLHAPMIELVSFLGLGVLTSIIYFGATVAPVGSAVVFMGASSRMFTAMSRKKQMPAYFDHVNPVYRISRRSLLMNAAFSILFIVLFRSWSKLAQFLSLLHILSYLPIPIALVVFRNVTKAKYRSYILPFGKFISLFLFVFFTYLFALGEFEVVRDIMLLFLVLHVIFIVINRKQLSTVFEAVLKSALLCVYFVYLTAMCYFSPANYAYSSALGQWPYDLILVLSSVVFFFVLTRSERNDEEVITSSVRIYQAEDDHSEITAK